MRTAEEFKAQAEKHGITECYHRPCSFCGYQTHYFFQDGKVFFDAGCDCVRGGSRHYERSWQHIADHYNNQNNPEVIKHLDALWKFESVEIKQ